DFGVPKEIRARERRVGLTPSGVLSLVRHGHVVYVETNAGAGAGFGDADYRDAGAKIVYSAAEAYGRADVVVKVSRPTAAEHSLFRTGQTIFSFLYLPVASPDLLQACRERTITAVAFEMIQEADGSLPVLLPTSELTGRLAPIIAGRLLMTDRGGRGVLLSGIPGVPPAAVVIIGGGVLGVNAARAFLGLRAEVTILDRDLQRLQIVDDMLDGRVTTMLSNHHNIQRAVAWADVLVTAIQTPGQRAPIIVTREMVQRMRRGSVIMDFSINHGGCVETSRPSTLVDPVYEVDGVLHYCVPNVAANVARTGSYALNNAALPYLRAIGEHGMDAMVSRSPALVQGINIYQGKLVHPAVAADLGLPLDMDLASGATV
ncbi:MAG: alanine dehydrogenase, partial [Caldilineaceae bacterium]|nr:alanine dehydrogenase [Caldilineaceae bacterium]